MSAAARDARRRAAFRWSRILVYAVLLLFALLYLIPVYVAVADSFKTLREVNTTSIWQPPASLDLGAWASALTPPLVGSGGIGPGIVNSVIMTVPAVVISSAWGSVSRSYRAVVVRRPARLPARAGVRGRL